MATGCQPPSSMGVYYVRDEFFRPAPMQLVYGSAANPNGWQQLAGRPAAPYYAPSATREADCQTGESVVDVPPVTKPIAAAGGQNKAAKKAPAALKADAATETPRHCEPTKGLPVSVNQKDGKKGFFARLFHKSTKGKSGKGKDKEDASAKVAKSHTTDGIAHKRENGCDATTSMSASCTANTVHGNECRSHQQQQQPPQHRQDCQLPTFSAQFPPLEWLPDPRFYHLMAATNWLACQQQQAAVDAHASSAGRYFAADEMLNQYNAPSTGTNGRQRRHDQQRRLTKCYSTSSECLQSIDEKQTLFERYAEAESARRRNRSMRRPQHHQPQQSQYEAPLIVPQSQLQQHNRVRQEKQLAVALRPQSTGDSALSASPVHTGSTGGSLHKYSSWSGSEANTESSVALPLPPVDRLTFDDPIDHTYINLDHRGREIPVEERLKGQDLRPAVARAVTYENLRPGAGADASNMYDTLDGPALPDVDVTPRAPAQPKRLAKIAPTYISAV